MRPSQKLLFIAFLLVLPVFFVQSCSAPDRPSHGNMPIDGTTASELHHNPGLALQMHYLQIWSHKMALSIDAQNLQLADFYHHEVEETVESIVQTVPEYDGYPIGELVDRIMTPTLESLEQALDAQDWPLIRSRYEQVIVSCNQCHAATDHGYIVITPGFGQNPFNQTFEVR